MSDLALRSAKRECAIHSQMKNPYIIELFEYTEKDDSLILYMELSNDPTYFEVKIGERLRQIQNETKMKSFVTDMLEALNYCHNIQQIVHADIKLENFLVHKPALDYDEFPIVKLCDFGLSIPMDSNGTAVMEAKSGTMGYLAPEIN